MKRRFFSLLLTLALLLTALIPSVGAADDLTGHWAESYLRAMNTHGIIKPNGTGAYTPNSVITRAEFMRYINRAFDFTQKADISKYTDVSTARWYYETVQIAAKYGYISGTGEASISPETPITREQVCSILGRLSKKNYPTVSVEELPFADAKQISGWCAPYVKALSEAGILVGDTNNCFRPKASVTRGEIARILYAFLGSQLDANAIYTQTELRADANSATITASCIVQDATFAGDVYISEGLGASSNITLRNVKIDGTLIVAGGTVSLDHVQCGKLLISSPFGTPLRVTAANDSKIATTHAETETTLTAASGSAFGTVSGKATTVNSDTGSGSTTELPTPSDTPDTPSTPAESTISTNAVTPAAQSIDRNAAANLQTEVVFSLTTIPNASLQHLLLGTSLLQAGTDYTYNSATGTVALSPGKLTSQNAGILNLTFVMTQGNNPTATVTVTDSTPQPTISPAEMVFSTDEKNPYHRDVTVWLGLNQKLTINHILFGNHMLLPGDDFLIIEDRIVLFRESLTEILPETGNTVELRFSLSDGSTPVLKLTCI